MGERRPASFYWLAALFALFVLFLYGPTLTILVLSFQGPTGGLTFPMQGVSVHWFGNLFEKQMVGDFAGSFERSMILGLVTMVVTVLLSFSAGLAFRKRFIGSGAVFYLAIVGSVIATFDGWRGNMYRIAMHPDLRRRGIAIALVREGERRLVEQGCIRIAAIVLLDEEHATGFWAAAGAGAARPAAPARMRATRAARAKRARVMSGSPFPRGSPAGRDCSSPSAAGHPLDRGSARRAGG